MSERTNGAGHLAQRQRFDSEPAFPPAACAEIGDLDRRLMAALTRVGAAEQRVEDLERLLGAFERRLVHLEEATWQERAG
jgi:hypothetical protein